MIQGGASGLEFLRFGWRGGWGGVMGPGRKLGIFGWVADARMVKSISNP
jgi:hypothetical protein